MPNGTVNDLQPGVRYRVIADFTDCYGDKVTAGTVLTYQKRDFLPYHGGHTITFAEQTIYLQEEQNAELLASLWSYLKPTGG